jgi:hypothetical protein
MEVIQHDTISLEVIYLSKMHHPTHNQGVPGSSPGGPTKKAVMKIS